MESSLPHDDDGLLEAQLPCFQRGGNSFIIPRLDTSVARKQSILAAEHCKTEALGLVSSILVLQVGQKHPLQALGMNWPHCVEQHPTARNQGGSGFLAEGLV